VPFLLLLLHQQQQFWVIHPPPQNHVVPVLPPLLLWLLWLLWLMLLLMRMLLLLMQVRAMHHPVWIGPWFLCVDFVLPTGQLEWMCHGTEGWCPAVCRWGCPCGGSSIELRTFWEIPPTGYPQPHVQPSSKQFILIATAKRQKLAVVPSPTSTPTAHSHTLN